MQSSRCHNVMTIYQLFHARAVCHASQARSGGFVRGYCGIHDGHGFGRHSCHDARCWALHGGDVTPRTASHGEELMCPMPSTTVLLTNDAGLNERDGEETSDVHARAACAHGCPAGAGGRTTLAGQVHGRSTCGESKRSQTKLLFKAHRTLALEPACAPLQIFVLVHELAPAPAFRFVTFSRRHTTDPRKSQKRVKFLRLEHNRGH